MLDVQLDNPIASTGNIAKLPQIELPWELKMIAHAKSSVQMETLVVVACHNMVCSKGDEAMIHPSAKSMPMHERSIRSR